MSQQQISLSFSLPRLAEKYVWDPSTRPAAGLLWREKVKCRPALKNFQRQSKSRFGSVDLLQHGWRDTSICRMYDPDLHLTQLILRVDNWHVLISDASRRPCPFEGQVPGETHREGRSAASCKYAPHHQSGFLVGAGHEELLAPGSSHCIRMTQACPDLQCDLTPARPVLSVWRPEPFGLESHDFMTVVSAANTAFKHQITQHPSNDTEVSPVSSNLQHCDDSCCKVMAQM